MTTGIQSNGIDLDSIFAAYQSGTHPPATGILVGGVDIATRYQPLPGTSAAATCIKTNGADLNTLFSTTSASGPLPINGQTYNASKQIISGSGDCSITFAVTGGGTGYAVTTTGHSASLPLTGSLPPGSTSIQYTWGTYSTSGNNDGGGSTSNGAATRTSVSSDPSATYTTNAYPSSTTGSWGRTYAFTIDVFNSAGTNISHTVTSIGAFVSGQG